MATPHRRLRCENVDITLEVGDGHHRLTVALAYDERGSLREMCFTGRGKIGHGMDMLLQDLGIKLSRAIQGRNPDTGDPS